MAIRKLFHVDNLFSNGFNLKVSLEFDVHCIKNKNVNSEDISDHCTLCTKSCIPADYMLSPNSALEGADFESKRMKNYVYSLTPSLYSYYTIFLSILTVFF